jgi:hypothetical protein
VQKEQDFEKDFQRLFYSCLEISQHPNRSGMFFLVIYSTRKLQQPRNNIGIVVAISACRPLDGGALSAAGNLEAARSIIPNLIGCNFGRPWRTD